MDTRFISPWRRMAGFAGAVRVVDGQRRAMTVAVHQPPRENGYDRLPQRCWLFVPLWVSPISVYLRMRFLRGFCRLDSARRLAISAQW